MPANLVQKAVIYIAVIFFVGGGTWLFLTSGRAPLPQYPVVTNVTTNSANVSWYTLSPTPGCVMAYIPKFFVWPWEIKFTCDSLFGKNNHTVLLSRLKNSVQYKVFIVNSLKRFEVQSFRTRDTASSEPTTSASGKVVDEAGAPVSNATAVFTFRGRAFSSQTDRQGLFNIKFASQNQPDPIERIYAVVNTYPYQTFSASFPLESINPVSNIILKK